MKKVINKTSLFFLILLCNIGFSQQFTTNRNPVGMEHNLLFNAATRYLVTNTGPALDLGTLFDGNMQPSYTTTAPTDVAPTVILIENLPGYHTQAGAWVGWSTRYWPANRFKIEGYDTYQGANTWRTISDYSTIDYNGADFNVAIPYGGAYTKLKFTFYKATGANGYLGVSELFFIHPEATSPYQGLLASALNNWENISSNLCYNTSTGKVGIGTTTPDEKLTVNGTIHATEVKVTQTVPPDYVFQKYYTGKSELKSDYAMPTLAEIESFTKKNHHLPNVPSAQEVQQNGVSLGTMSNVLLQKVEELTLYAIEQNKELERLKKENNVQSKEIKTLKKENEMFIYLSKRLTEIENQLK